MFFGIIWLQLKSIEFLWIPLKSIEFNLKIFEFLWIPLKSIEFLRIPCERQWSPWKSSELSFKSFEFPLTFFLWNPLNLLEFICFFSNPLKSMISFEIASVGLLGRGGPGRAKGDLGLMRFFFLLSNAKPRFCNDGQERPAPKALTVPHFCNGGHRNIACTALWQCSYTSCNITALMLTLLQPLGPDYCKTLFWDLYNSKNIKLPLKYENKAQTLPWPLDSLRNHLKSFGIFWIPLNFFKFLWNHFKSFEIASVGFWRRGGPGRAKEDLGLGFVFYWFLDVSMQNAGFAMMARKGQLQKHWQYNTFAMVATEI